MNRALLNIDYTFDFVDNSGKLTCGEPGQIIEANISEITKQFLAENNFVVFAVDLHKEKDIFHPEHRLFPPHNIEGSRGRCLYGDLQSLYEKHKRSSSVYWLDKTRYSAFAGTNLELILRERNVNELHLIGVCTDICVLHTAVDAYNKGFKIVIHKDAVASFNDIGHKWALEHFKKTLGAEIV
ncbi:cysteine hydrolase family protein [Bacillus mexicanus]|uniref:cysteine hydrolase family protein n=1 Tax=Bacillus mexicanus TaxID=2834415 RepID=UPI003D1F0AA1